MKIKIFIIKIYSLSNYKINIFSFFKKIIKKKKVKCINYLYYLINNLNYYNKKKLSSTIYLLICNFYSKKKFFKNSFFLLNKKNIYLQEIIKYYKIEEILFFKKNIKIIKKISLKNLKKIFTNILIKIKNNIYENLEDRYNLTFLYTFINNKNKIKEILKYTYYINESFFYFLNNIKKICSLIHSNKEEYSNKIHIGMLKNSNNNLHYYLLFIIKNLIKKNVFKINISLEIYNFDILKIIKKIKIFKKIKINLIIGIPDIFIEYIIKNKNWFLIDSKKIKKEYNYYLQSFYDEYIGYGTLRETYKKILKNKKILKISLNSIKLLKIIFKNKIKIIFLDKINRNNINKHIGCLLSNFYQNKIFDRNNYFDRKLFYVKNTNIILQRSNVFYLELKINQNFLICKNNIKKYYFKYKMLILKNDFFISQREINFHLNFRLYPIIFNINNLKKKFKNYLFFKLLKINSLFSKKSFPYNWYPGSDIYNEDFFYKNNFFSNKWNELMNYIRKHKIKSSIKLNYKKKKKNLITTFDNYLFKFLLLKWQFYNEEN